MTKKELEAKVKKMEKQIKGLEAANEALHKLNETKTMEFGALDGILENTRLDLERANIERSNWKFKFLAASQELVDAEVEEQVQWYREEEEREMEPGREW